MGLPVVTHSAELRQGRLFKIPPEKYLHELCDRKWKTKKRKSERETRGGFTCPTLVDVGLELKIFPLRGQ